MLDVIFTEICFDRLNLCSYNIHTGHVELSRLFSLCHNKKHHGGEKVRFKDVSCQNVTVIIDMTPSLYNFAGILSVPNWWRNLWLCYIKMQRSFVVTRKEHRHEGSFEMRSSLEGFAYRHPFIYDGDHKKKTSYGLVLLQMWRWSCMFIAHCCTI